MVDPKVYAKAWIVFRAEQRTEVFHVLELIGMWGLGIFSSGMQPVHPQEYVHKIVINTVHDLEYIKDKLQSLGVFLLEIGKDNTTYWRNKKYDGSTFLPGSLTVKQIKRLEKKKRKSNKNR
ncbi:hypothetical protein COU14_03020 [Candidatus Kaiserbacteria bacterium CG10_big_fil_rev_8_21_14_0_10_44_10]|uniref:Uncharacterized protein n=1 Tax=Candidatus Kaiserbacteria bacterium CG10_big_fil_rev_8_21_14_0_10_44_10 TaxID=1974606 RepID=A0A2H0UGX8_9BACT|nr:MAG: hypothetical protein COU14_03020 [Candidatus Kaiserbacteria bacterium CG10_big_fil_rev_8_21_14_0_10_44_10]